MAKEITVPEKTAELLRTLAARYETASFEDGDPIQFLCGTHDPADCETTGFVAASLSYGSRKQFLPKIAEITKMAGGNVHRWILDGDYAERFSADDTSSFYRLFSHALMRRLFDRLRKTLQTSGTIGGYLRGQGATDGLSAVKALCGAFCGCAAPAVPCDATSACKRLCMFLRWMVRDGSPVDAGLWSGWFDKRTLIMPLDVHVMRQAKRLGLLAGGSPSMATALRLTKTLATVFPDDPLKGDFALYGLGVDTTDSPES